MKEKEEKSKVVNDIETLVDFSLQNDPELREKVMKAFASVKAGNVGNVDDLKRKLFGSEEA
jgi:hypothetical protein